MIAFQNENPILNFLRFGHAIHHFLCPLFVFGISLLGVQPYHHLPTQRSWHQLETFPYFDGSFVLKLFESAFNSSFPM
jgi:hypothetical protein